MESEALPSLPTESLTSPARKRKHASLEAGSDPVNASLERSTEVYFEDGNIVVAAEDVAFRVHRGQLARRSEVFRDMFLISQRTESEEVFDGCLVVRVSDGALAMMALLKALYDTTQFNTSSVSDAVLMLPLTDKYMIEDVRTSIMDMLKKNWYPESLDSWIRSAPHPPIDPQIHADILSMGDFAMILAPSANYRLCQLPIRDVLALRWSRAACDRFIIGRDDILDSWLKILQTIRTEGIRPVCPVRSCDQAMQKELKELDAPRTRSVDPVMQINASMESFRMAEMCTDCKQHSIVVLRGARDSFWANLPRYFGLRSWRRLQGTS